MTTVATRQRERQLTRFLHEVGKDIFRISQRTIPAQDKKMRSDIYNSGQLILKKEGFEITYGNTAIEVDSPSEYTPNFLKPTTVSVRGQYRRSTQVQVTSSQYKNVTSFSRKGGYVRAHKKTWRVGTRPIQDPKTKKWYTETLEPNFGHRMAAAKAKNNWVMDATNKILNRLSPTEVDMLIESGAIPQLI